METKAAAAFLFLIVCCVPLAAGNNKIQKRHIFKSNKPDNIMDVSDFSVYYNLDTNEGLASPRNVYYFLLRGQAQVGFDNNTIRKMLPRPWYKPGWLLRLPFNGGRCICEELKCSCCTGVRIAAFNFDRRTCAILNYDPAETMIDLQVTMNNDTVYRNSYSARNPPPFCVPVPIPYLPPGLVDMCIRLFDINVVEQKLHVCMDMDTRIDKAPVLVLHFDCMDMGFNGVGLSKPGGSPSTNLTPETDNGSTTPAEPTQVDFDIYDPVTEKMPTTQTLFNNTVKYI